MSLKCMSTCLQLKENNMPVYSPVPLDPIELAKPQAPLFVPGQSLHDSEAERMLGELDARAGMLDFHARQFIVAASVGVVTPATWEAGEPLIVARLPDVTF